MQRDIGTPHGELLPGTLHMMVLKILTRGPMHGYAIAQQIKLISEDVLRVEEGSLYPALQRMLLKGWVTAEWVPAGPKRRARVYRLTPEGRKQLAEDVATFARVTAATFRVIQPA